MMDSIKKIRFNRVILHIVLIIGSIISVFPFIWMITTAFKGQSEVFSTKLVILPTEWKFDNFVDAITTIPFGRFYLNTIIITVARVVGQLIIASMAGYGFARLRFPGRDVLFWAIMAAMMVPFQVTLVPDYILLRTLGWLDTYTGLIIPSLVSSFGIFLLRQFFLTLPQDLEDAAIVDGCNPFQTFWHVSLPLAKPILGSFGFLVALWSWNDFIWPLIVTRSTEMQTLSVALSLLQGQYVSNFGVLMAAATMTILPMIILFIFAQRYVIEGITMSGLKL